MTESMSASTDTSSGPPEKCFKFSPGAKLCQLFRFLDSDYFAEGSEVVRARTKRVEFDRCLPFLFLHLACLGVFLVGVSQAALLACFLSYFIRMFAITGFYHRYFSHRSFKTSRLAQFFFAFLGASSAQRGPLWWASHHRQHHRYADQEGDVHSPKLGGFIWSHIGWITASANMPTDYDRIKDLTKYPELVLINRFDWVAPLVLGTGFLFLGDWLKLNHPTLNTDGPQLLVWGFFVSTVILFHATCSINSISHMFGSRHYNLKDDSRNNFLCALITLGEGWHNNHHRYQGSARQGFFWWELDLTYLMLRSLAVLGVVHDLHPVPQAILEEAT